MKLFEGIEAVTFDVGGTLIEPLPSVGDIYAQVAARHSIKGPDIATLNKQFGAAWKAKGDFDYSKESWFELIAKSFGVKRAKLADEFLEDLYQRFAEPDVWKIHEDVMPAWDELASRGINIGIVSNWDERLRPLLRKLKLVSYLDTITISCEIGFTKPSPVIFEQALKDLGVPAPAALHVGDNRREDLGGAEQAGMQSLLLNRSGKGDIRSLREVATLLA